jgi:hypothetical protein
MGPATRIRARNSAECPGCLRQPIAPRQLGNDVPEGTLRPRVLKAGDHHGKVNGTAEAIGYSSARDFSHRAADL